MNLAKLEIQILHENKRSQLFTYQKKSFFIQKKVFEIIHGVMVKKFLLILTSLKVILRVI